MKKKRFKFSNLIIFFLCIFLIFRIVNAINYGEGSYNYGDYGVGGSSVFCGDGICNNGETCSSCPTDCGICSGGGNNYKDIDSHSTINQNEEAVFEFGKYLAIRKIKITAIKKIHSPRIIIEYLNSYYDQKKIPELIDGFVYHYEEIIPNFQNRDIKNAIINFRIEDDWLKNNNLKPKDIVLKRYTNRWDDLKTRFIEEKYGYYYFEADTPGFSYFAIGNRTENEEVTEGTIVSEQKDNREQIIEPNENITKSESNIKKSPESDKYAKNADVKNKIGIWIKQNIISLIVLVLIIILGSILFLFFSRKKENKSKHQTKPKLVKKHRFKIKK